MIEIFGKAGLHELIRWPPSLWPGGNGTGYVPFGTELSLDADLFRG